MNNKRIIAPSILSANFTKMDDEIEKIAQSGAQWIHLDVMDGSFVPPITFGHKMVEDIRPLSSLVLDVHLMVDNPESQIPHFVAAGGDSITFHHEAVIHSHRLLEYIKKQNCKAGISIVPSTHVEALYPVLYLCDLVLIMTVNPGYGGQSMITPALEKVEQLRKVRDEQGLDFLISIDGGVNLKTIDEVNRFNPDVLVAGSAFFSSPNPGDLVKELMK